MGSAGAPSGVWRRRRGRVLVAVVLVCGAAWALLVRYDRPRAPAGAWIERAGLNARTAQVDGTAVRYVRAGSGPPLLLVHGFASSSYTWSALIPELARRHDVVALDLPGFGASDMPADLAWPALPAAVLGVMDRLAWPRAVLVGHSLGGAVALSVAVQAPERVERLVLVDAAGFALGPRERPGVIQLVASRPLAPLVEHVPLRRVLLHVALRQVFHDPARITPERVEAYLAPLLRPGWLPAMRSLLGGTSGPELEGFPVLVAHVRVPTLVVWGREDRWIPLDHAWRFEAAIPGARAVVLEDCGHVPQEERPAEMLRLLAEFLAPPVGGE